MKRPIIYTVCQDISCLRGENPPSTAIVHIKMQLKFKKEIQREQDEVLLLQKQFKKKLRQCGTTVVFSKSRSFLI